MSEPKKKLSESKEWNLIGDYANALERIGELQRQNARLKAEVERLRAMDSLKTISLSESADWQLIGHYAEAKEEIERLTAEKAALVQQGIRDHGDWRSKLNFLEADYKAEIARLRDENERMRKAGDKLQGRILICLGVDVCEEDYGDDARKDIAAWHAAKEVQS